MHGVAATLLVVAGMLSAGLAFATFVAPPTHGYSGLGEVLAMLAAASLRWIVLAVLLGWCAKAGHFGWVPGARSTWGRMLMVLAAQVMLGGLSGIAMFAVADDSVLHGISPSYRRLVHIAGQVGCTVPAVSVIACLLSEWRQRASRAPALPLISLTVGVLAGLVVIGTMVGQDIRDQRDHAVRVAAAAAEREVATRNAFASLTDADSLLRWDEFVHGSLQDDALRRLSLRPTLEQDLIHAFGCDCRNSSWTGELLWLVGAIPFEPGPDLVDPVREAAGLLVESVRAGATHSHQDTRDIWVDLYHVRDLQAVRVAALKLARSAHADLRPSMDEMRRAVVETYPKSEAARRYPAEVDRTSAEIEGLLRWR